MTPAPLFIAIVLIAAETPAADPNDPLAPARSGQLQCYTPNVAKKTCHALAQYNFAPDGGIENPAEVIISEKPLIIMKGTAPVVVRDGAVCGPFDAQSLQQSTFTIAGNPAPEPVAQQIRAQLLMTSAARLGKEICTKYVPDRGQFAAQVTVDGAPHPEMADRVIWVKPEDGFKVAP